MRQFTVIASVALCAILVSKACWAADSSSDISAADLMTDIYTTCLSGYSTGCVKPKALAWISSAVKSRQIKITEDLSIIKTNDEDPIDFKQQRSGDPRVELFDKIDSFLASHSIRINAPAILKTEQARSFVSYYPDLNLETSLELPLTEGNVAEGNIFIRFVLIHYFYINFIFFFKGRGFVKKVMIPFLLGLKFKTTVLLPLAFALIALKTWKATTLGLLSMVLSAAMVIFKFAKPKVKIKPDEF